VVASDSAMARLAARLQRAADDPAVGVRPLAGGQLIVQSHMVDNPAAGQGLKASSEIPGRAGFEIHVARHIGRSAAPTQRMARPRDLAPPRWDPESMTLELEAGDTARQWAAINTRGEAITVRVRCGPAAPRAELNVLLRIIEAELFAG
jgi:hypothetical protein